MTLSYQILYDILGGIWLPSVRILAKTLGNGYALLGLWEDAKWSWKKRVWFLCVRDGITHFHTHWLSVKVCVHKTAKESRGTGKRAVVSIYLVHFAIYNMPREWRAVISFHKLLFLFVPTDIEKAPHLWHHRLREQEIASLATLWRSHPCVCNLFPFPPDL